MSNDQNETAKTVTIMELYNSVMKTAVKKC